MGYETNVLILNRSRCFGDSPRSRFCGVINIMDMSKCDPEFNALFDKVLEGEFYLPGNGNEHFVEDVYGDPAKEANIETVYNWLSLHIVTAKMHKEFVYRRYVMLHKLLEHFIAEKETYWKNEDIIIARYGH